MDIEFRDMVGVVDGWLRKESEEKRNDFINTPKEKLIVYHTTLGRSIRNEFKLWEKEWKPDIRNGIDYSEDHPDQVSTRVIEEVWSQYQNAD